MSGSVSGVFLASTVTLTASGTHLLSKGFSNGPFKNLSLTVKPVEANTHYTVTVYFDGEVEETHTYPTDTSTICHMNFPNMVFPPNAGVNAIPVFFENGRFNPEGVGIAIAIQSLEPDRRSFLIYACFEDFDNCRFGKI